MLSLTPIITVTVNLIGSGSGVLNFVPADTEISLFLAPLAKGDRGLPGFSSSVVAAEALGGHRAVTVDGFHASPADADKLAGISMTSGVFGATVDVVVKGLMEEGSWNWTPGLPVFIGAAGVLTQNPSTTGLIRRIAWAVSPTSLNVDILPPIAQS